MKTKFTTICSREKLSEIRSFLQVILGDANIPQSTRDEVILAVDEACANAIIHGNGCDEKKTLQLEIALSKEKLSVEIYDVGNTAFPAEEFKSRDISELIHTRQKGGLGLKLMYSIMDEVNYYQSNGVNVCSLSKIL